MNLKKLFEVRVLAILGIIALSWHLLGALSSFLAFFTDIFLLFFLSWILAFIFEPLVHFLTKNGFNRILSAIIIYAGIALVLFGLVWSVLPTIISQISQFAVIIPLYLPQNSVISLQLQSFLSTSLSNSVAFASQIASGITSLILIFILSFYLLISKEEISETILKIIPDEYEDDYLFFEKVINTSFATFLRVQVFFGLLIGLVTFVSLSILQINFAISTSIISAVLSMVPVIGAFLLLIPPALAAITVSPEKAIIITTILILTAQLIYNVLGPKLLGKELKIHPIIVFLSFLIGYKIAGFWGATFALPVTSALVIIGKDLLKHWREEADK